MLIEFQMPVTAYCTSLQNHLKNVPFCYSQSVQLPLPGCGGAQYIDFVEVSDGTTLANNGDGSLEVIQPVVIYFVSADALVVSGFDPARPCNQLAASVSLNLAAVVVDGSPSLCLTVNAIDAPQVPGAVSSALFPADLLAPVVIDLAPIEAMLGRAIEIVALGISLDTSGTRMAVRIQIAPEGGPSRWSSFYEGTFLTNSSADWALFIDARLMTESIRALFARNLARQVDDNLIREVMEPGVSHYPGTAMFGVTTSFEAYQACVCGPVAIDVDIDVSASMQLSVPKENVLRTNLSITWALNDLEVACCALTTASFWWLFGTDLLQKGPSEGGIGWGEFLAGLLPWNAFTAIVVGAHGAAAKNLEIPGFQKVGEDPEQWVMDSDLELSIGDGFPMALTSLGSDPYGVVLQGTLARLTKVTQARLHTSPFDVAFVWDFADRCAHNLEIVARYEVSFVDGNAALPGANGPLEICSVTIVDGTDALGQFGPYLQWDRFGMTIEIPRLQFHAAYVDEPYPCRVRIISSAGVRIITVPACPNISDEAAAQMIEEQGFAQDAFCGKWLAEFGWPGTRFFPKWVPDPGPEGSVQFWNVFVTGMRAGERVWLGAGTTRIADGVASASGVLQLGALLEERRMPGSPLVFSIGQLPAEGLETLARAQTFAPARGPRPPHSREGARTCEEGQLRASMRQVVLAPVGNITLAEPTRGFSVGEFRRMTALGVVTESGVRAYCLDARGEASLLYRRREQGVRGCVAWRGGLLYWGASGLQHLTSTGKSTILVDPVDDVVVSQRGLHVLQGGRVLTLDRALATCASREVGMATVFVLTENYLVTPGSGKLCFHRLGSDQVYEVALPDVCAVRGLSRPKFTGEHDAVAVRTDRDSRIVVPGDRRERVRYFEEPWFAQLHVSRGLYARHVAHTTNVRIYRPCESRVVVSSAPPSPADEYRRASGISRALACACSWQ